MSERQFSKQAELDFMHNFRHDTEGDRWAKHEIETLRQQLTEREKYVKLLRDAIHDGCLCIAQYGEQPPDCLLEALAATEPKP